eukprot:m.102250 g.102250  ORF g.102250 m.102250 type:complete len:66 (+) comp8997_c0_seq3:107-304(+)
MLIPGCADVFGVQKACENRQCLKSFHYACLLEWLRSDPETRQSFDTLFGDCPYCSTTLSLKLEQA